MPLGVVGSVGASVLTEAVVLRVAVDNVELGIAFDVAGGGVPVDGAEVSAQALGFGRLRSGWSTYLAISIWRSGPRSLKS